jgi:DNA uptake protein ComE-like DNA-binding protein
MPEQPMKYKVIAGPLYVNNKPVENDKTVDLLPSTAKELVAAKVIELVGEGTPPPEEIPKINLNTAGEEELIALDHIGKATAQKLIAARPIAVLEDAQKVLGLKPEQWSAIAPRLMV